MFHTFQSLVCHFPPVHVCIPTLGRFVKKDAGVQEKSVTELTLATFSHMRHPYQLLLLPFTIYSGLEQQFLSSDFTAVSLLPL